MNNVEPFIIPGLLISVLGNGLTWLCKPSLSRVELRNPSVSGGDNYE
jgi:hypothetical protein